MASHNRQIGWLEEIAERSKYPKEVIQNLLNKYDVQQSPNIGTPKHLYLRRVWFEGTKKGVHQNDFTFDFNDLKPGIFGLITDGNLKGKTTVLEVIKWLLRGSSSDKLQEGVKSWISKARLDFAINSELYQVSLIQTDGEVNGELILLSGDTKRTIICSFYSSEEFENCMSDFMVKQFSFGKVVAFRNSRIEEEVGVKVSHDWPALSSALFISTNYSSLFGEVVSDGLNNRLMNMYLGLPWIPTYSALKSLESQLNSEKKVEAIHVNRELERKQNRYQEIENELKERKKTLSTVLRKNSDIQNEITVERKKHGELIRQIIEIDKMLRSLSHDLEASKEALLDDEKRLTNFKEDMAAKAVFKRLEPTCCPHCEKPITKEKIEKEKTEHLCSICDEPLLESEDAESLVKELELNLKASKRAFTEIKREYQNLSIKHSDVSASLSATEENIQQLELELGKSVQQFRIEQEVFRLEVLKEEYSTVSQPKAPEEKKDSIDEKTIVKAAVEITKKRFDELQKELLLEVNQELLRISKLVGLGSMEAFELTSIPSLKIIKDGSSTTYSKVSPGEKLRLKVITTIALLSVAEKRKVGRHPGLLLIDSPAAQEVTDKDVNSLIEGLEKLTAELPFMQIIIASRATHVILSHFKESQRKYATGDNYLW